MELASHPTYLTPEKQGQPGAPDGDDLQRLAQLESNLYLERSGRTRKLTASLRRRFIALLAEGYSPTRAAQAVGVTRPAVYYWRNVDPDIREAWAEALEQRADRYEDALEHSAIEQHNIGGIIFGLKNLRPNKWRDRHEIEQRSLAVTWNLDALPPAQQAAIARAVLHAVGGDRDDNCTITTPALPAPSDSEEASLEAT